MVVTYCSVLVSQCVSVTNSFMQRPVHPSFGWVKPIMDGYKYGWTGGGWVKNEGAKKRSSKTIYIVSYALKVSVNGVTCVFVVLFRSSGTFESL